MKKYILGLIFIGSLTHNTFAERYSASKIEECCLEYLNPGVIYYYIATPNEVLAQGVSGLTKSKNKNLVSGQHQVQTYQITRTMTVAAIMLLQEQNKLSLNDSILKYIPVDYWPNRQPASWASQATIYHLLASTSCIASYRYKDDYKFSFDKEIDEESFKKKVLLYATNEPIFYGEVGGMYTHSETNYFILGMIIEYISKQKLSQFFRKNFFEPLGMRDTFLPNFGKHGKHRNTANKNKKSNPFLAFGDGGVIASLGDIHKWNIALHNMKILQKPSYDQITKLHSSIDTCCQFSRSTLDMLGRLSKNECVYYGYGLYIIPMRESHEDIYCSEPDSYSGEEMWFLPHKNISIILLSDIPKPKNEKIITTLRNDILHEIYY